jgi:NAD(P)-dependent dehydrogenase (short-subunit alcohol dehydrogenase family)
MPSKPVVVVTGASRGLGLAIVDALLESGEVNIVGVSRSLPAAHDHQRIESTSATNVKCVWIRGDVTEATTHDQIVKAISELGELIGLVNNAG